MGLTRLEKEKRRLESRVDNLVNRYVACPIEEALAVKKVLWEAKAEYAIFLKVNNLEDKNFAI